MLTIQIIKKKFFASHKQTEVASNQPPLTNNMATPASPLSPTTWLYPSQPLLTYNMATPASPLSPTTWLPQPAPSHQQHGYPSQSSLTNNMAIPQPAPSHLQHGYPSQPPLTYNMATPASPLSPTTWLPQPAPSHQQHGYPSQPPLTNNMATPTSPLSPTTWLPQPAPSHQQHDYPSQPLSSVASSLEGCKYHHRYNHWYKTCDQVPEEGGHPVTAHIHTTDKLKVLGLGRRKIACGMIGTCQAANQNKPLTLAPVPGTAQS